MVPAPPPRRCPHQCFWFEDWFLQRTSFPYGPRNTYSNVAYLLAGYVAFRLSGDPYIVGFLIYLGLGSFAYHGFKNRVTSAFDISGMFGVFGYITFGGFVPGVFLATVGLAAVLNEVDIPVHGIIGVTLGLAVIDRFMDPLTFAALVVFAVAFGIWILDKRAIPPAGEVRPKPLLGLWGHAVWHVLTSIAIVMLYQSAR